MPGIFYHSLLLLSKKTNSSVVLPFPTSQNQQMILVFLGKTNVEIFKNAD